MSGLDCYFFKELFAAASGRVCGQFRVLECKQDAHKKTTGNCAKWTSAASRHTPVLHTQGRKADYSFTQVADHYNTILLVGGK